MNTIPVTAAHLEYWADENPKPVTFDHPDPDVKACATVVTGTPAEPVVRVPWQPSPEDIAALAAGGTVWVSCWGGLPPHQLEVQASPAGHREN